MVVLQTDGNLWSGGLHHNQNSDTEWFKNKKRLFKSFLNMQVISLGNVSEIFVFAVCCDRMEVYLGKLWTDYLLGGLFFYSLMPVDKQY